MNQFLSVVRFIGRSSKRIGVTAAGFVLLAGGLIMMVTPGPGLLLIVAGLAVLGTEYAWARRALAMAKERAKQAGDQVRKRTRRRDPGP